ncbi:hypothetical protein [Antrihabitans sp. YC2-6]|uniref:hypothetical protein n=1 Tax=Antrihabitans sp. YC2-6 TaxID=2799498 RepID=UPI0018F62F2E|nr:hypothetical protein [Antrihabitans sp. YC2-6]MBJ8345270.1 hypothetical protein [Antrihabitans sp. YC2-6]
MTSDVQTEDRAMPEVAHQQTVLEALQRSPLGPFLDLPLPQLPTIPGLGLPQLPALPQLPPNPLDALLSGQGLPALPGVDQLLKPITDLASGFGSGVLGSLDPTALLQQSSGLIDTAMQVGMGGLKVLDQLWQSEAAQNAQAQGRQAQGSGEEVVQRGNDISTVTQDAAATVQRGNAKLALIAESFATSAVAAAPLILTPPGQMLMMTAAAEHISQAIEVVAQTRAELGGHTARMSGLSEPVPVPAGPNANTGATGPSPFAIASTLLESVGKPLVSTVTSGLEKLVEAGTAATHAATTSADSPGLATTHSAGPSGGSTGPGGGNTGGGIGLAAPGVGSGTGGGTHARPVQGVVGSSGQGADRPSTATTAGTSSATMAAAAGGMGMGGMMPPMMPQRVGENELQRSTPTYLVDAINRTDVIGDLGTVVSPVLGAEDPDELDENDV